MSKNLKTNKTLKVRKKNAAVAGVIDIGSNGIRLKIGQNIKNKYSVIEEIEYPLNLGRDTFNLGKISFEKADQCCAILKDFLQVCTEYGVKEPKVVATTAIREASNRDYVLDQIKIQTGTQVKILDNQEEKYYIFRMMCSLIQKEDKCSALMAYIGSGNLGVSCLENGDINYAQNIKLGSLRINELFEMTQQYSKDYYIVVEEYLESIINNLEGYIPETIQNFVVSGSDIRTICALCSAEARENVYYIDKERLVRLYDEIKYKSVALIQRDYNLPYEKAEVILPAICIYNSFLTFTKAEKIIAPYVHLVDGLIYELLYPKDFAIINKDFTRGTLLSARNIAKRFNCDGSHAATVEKYALTIFDKMKKEHDLSQRERLILQVAAILHDVGKYVNQLSAYKHSYEIISNLDIIGLSAKEIEIAANICYYYVKSDMRRTEFMLLSARERIIIAKLSAILRLADSLDRSHRHKFDTIAVKVTDEKIMITIQTDKNVELEEWYFDLKADFFEEVFGIKSVLSVKKVLL